MHALEILNTINLTLIKFGTLYNGSNSAVVKIEVLDVFSEEVCQTRLEACNTFECNLYFFLQLNVITYGLRMSVFKYSPCKGFHLI